LLALLGRSSASTEDCKLLSYSYLALKLGRLVGFGLTLSIWILLETNLLLFLKLDSEITGDKAWPGEVRFEKNLG
jgi:hypothetical protein